MTEYDLTPILPRSRVQNDKSIVRDGDFEVIWKNLTFGYQPSWYNVFKRGGPTPVLKDVSGSFKSNQLVAIIGPSGCGKTTLLQFLAGNNPSQRDKLKIVGLDEPKVAFIGQDDSLLPGLTAYETLIFASKLQNNQANFNHVDHVTPILNQLGLVECAHRNITKLSGGQLKRVIIAQELLYPTNILILDEVTSGLDASTSYSIVKLLKCLVADTNCRMSIVLSIHQPSARLFSIFDQVYVMGNGSCLYEGSCDFAVVNSYLRNFDIECPKYHNIADFLIEIACDDLNEDNKLLREQMIQYQRKRSEINPDNSRTVMINEKFFVADQNEESQQNISMLMHNDSILYDSINRARLLRPRSLFGLFRTHFYRSFVRISRSYILTYLQLITYIILGLQLSTFYGHEIGKLSGCPRLPTNLLTYVLSNDSTEDDITREMRRIQENINFLLVAVLTATFAALEITVITFPLEAKTVKREWRNGWYGVTSYFMGRTFADLPFQLSFLFIFCLLIYLMTGQLGLISWRFGSFLLIMTMIALVAQSVGFIFGAIFMNNLPAAVFTAPLCIFPALLFSGFFSRVSQIPHFYRPMTYLSHFRYGFDALLVTLYGFERCSCDQETLAAYHISLQNQTVTVKEMFKYLFGSVDCADSDNSKENSIEDTSNPPDLVKDIFNLTNSSTSPSPIPVIPTTKYQTIEDTLVDTVFQHINKTTEAPLGQGGDMSAMDHLAHKFSSRITNMLNRQSNFGHHVPETCHEFNSYLMTEFDLQNENLIYGLIMLFAAVVLMRILCNSILNFTIASRI